MFDSWSLDENTAFASKMEERIEESEVRVKI